MPKYLHNFKNSSNFAVENKQRATENVCYTP